MIKIMKKNELLEKLKQGEFDLDTPITFTQFKDIEVAKYYFKNIVEQSSLVLFKNEIKYNINRILYTYQLLFISNSFLISSIIIS